MRTHAGVCRRLQFRRYSSVTRSMLICVRIDQGCTMKDLTKDSIARHILLLSGPIAAGMLSQIAYQLVNLYFVSRVGAAAIAGVSIAANVIFIVTAVTHVLSVGTAARVAHATGGKDQHGAIVAFNQAVGLSLFCGAAAVTVLWALAPPYMRSMSADPAIADAGTSYIHAILPGLVLTFPVATLGAALRGSGVVRPHACSSKRSRFCRTPLSRQY